MGNDELRGIQRSRKGLQARWKILGKQSDRRRSEDRRGDGSEVASLRAEVVKVGILVGLLLLLLLLLVVVVQTSLQFGRSYGTISKDV